MRPLFAEARGDRRSRERKRVPRRLHRRYGPPLAVEKGVEDRLVGPHVEAGIARVDRFGAAHFPSGRSASGWLCRGPILSMPGNRRGNDGGTALYRG